MATRSLLLPALWLLSPVLSAQGAAQTVTAARVIATARHALDGLALEPGTQLGVRVVGKPVDAVVPAGPLSLQGSVPAGHWPRSRVAVPVRLSVAGAAVRTETVWFAVTATRKLAVYAADAAQASPADNLQTRQADVDTAQLHGHPVSLAALKGQRLRRAVLEGAPLLAEDFELVPDVDARQQVTVLVRYGAIRMETRGTALGIGNAGQLVPVLAAGADSPVQARVTARGVVELAR